MMNLGIFEKVVLSDTLLAPVADMVFAAPHAAGTLDAWVGALAEDPLPGAMVGELVATIVREQFAGAPRQIKARRPAVSLRPMSG